jgi:hypothetical protein
VSCVRHGRGQELLALTVLAGMVLAAGPAIARSRGGAPADLQSRPRSTDSFVIDQVGQIGGPAFGVAVQGKLAYVTIGPRMAVVDVSDDRTPRVVGTSEALPRLAQSVVVEGGFAFVIEADYDEHAFNELAGAALRIIDVRNPFLPQLRGVCAVPGDARDVSVANGYAYVATQDAGLRIIDVGDPDLPREVASANVPHGARGAKVSEGRVYVAVGSRRLNEREEGGMVIFDVSDPPHPVEMGSLFWTGKANDVAVAGKYAIVGTGIYTTGYYGIVRINENRPGLKIIDISNVGQPREVGFLRTPSGVFDVTVNGGRARILLGGYSGHLDAPHIWAVDLAEPAFPKEMADVSSEDAYAVAVLGNLACVADGEGGLELLDVSSDDVVRETARMDVLGRVMSVAARGNTIFAGEVEDGFWVIDAGRPEDLRAVTGARTRDSNPIASIAVRGDYAYLGVAQSYYRPRSGIRVFDVARLRAPLELDYYFNVEAGASPGNTSDVEEHAGYLYVASCLAGRLWALDLSQGEAPPVVGTFDWSDANSEVRAVAFEGHYAFVAISQGSSHGSLRVLDIAEPTNLREVGSIALPDQALGVAVEGTYAYVSDSESGLQLIDVSDPTHLHLLDSSQVMTAYRTHVDREYVYVLGTEPASDLLGMWVFETTNESRLTQVGYRRISYVGRYWFEDIDFVVDGSTIFVAAWEAGILALRVSPASDATPAATEGVTPTRSSAPDTPSSTATAAPQCVYFPHVSMTGR